MVKKKYLDQILLERNKDEKKQLELKERVFKTFNNFLKYSYKSELKEKMELLDLGSADNSFIKVANKHGLHSTGLDIDQVNFENQDLPFEDNKFDVVTANSVIEHINNPEIFLKNIRRVLKDKGFFIIVTPNWRYSYKNFYNDPTHVHPYTPESLNFLLKSFKFENIRNVPWLVLKPLWLWDLPFNFKIASLIPFRNDASKMIPGFLKGQSRVILSVSQKN